VVCVEPFEGCLQVFFTEDLLFVHGCEDKLGVLDVPASVGIDFLEDLVDLARGSFYVALYLCDALEQLIAVDASIPVEVERHELLLIPLDVVSGEELGRYEAKHRALQLPPGMKPLKRVH
jgi:hypothetical protein